MAIFWGTKCRYTLPRLIVIVEVIRFGKKKIHNCLLMYKFGYLYLVPLFKSVDWHINLPHCVSACNMCLWQASLD
jgi:hypothetical protein